MTNRINDVKNKLVGPIVAMTTHFKDDLSIDLDAMRILTEYYVNCGIKTVIVTGSTGQFVTLTDEERVAVQKAVIDAAAGRITVIAGTAHSSTQTVIDLTKQAEDLGADAVMVTPPYGGYNNGGFGCLQSHYDIVSKNTDIGIVIYFSGNCMHLVRDIIAAPEMMVDLIESCNGHAVGFKDASKDFNFYRDVTLLLKDKVAVIGSGGLNYYFWGHHFGSPSFLTAAGNIWPQVDIEFGEHMANGDYAAARKIVIEKDLPYLRACRGTRRYWSCLHALQEMVGLPGGPMRAPMMGLNPEEKETLRETCTKIGLFDIPVDVPN